METEQKNMAEEVKIPELQIHSVWKRLINRVRHVGFIYWVIMIIAALIIVLSLIPDTALQTFWEKSEEQKLLVSLVLLVGAVT